MAGPTSLLERILLEKRDANALAFEHRMPEGPSVVSTWGTLRDGMWRLAEAFDDRLPQGAPVVLVCTHGPEFAQLMVAGFLSGRPVIPASLSPFLPPAENVTRLLSIALAAKAGAFVCSGRAAALAPFLSGALQKIGLEGRMQVHTFEELDGLLPKGTGKERPLPQAGGPALIQFTSGSTGSPRGVLLTLENLREESVFIATHFGHDASSRGAIWLPHVHNTGLVGGVLQPLFIGFPCHFLDPAQVVGKPELWLRLISEVRATTSGGPNFIFDACTAAVDDKAAATLDLSSWRVAFTGAEPVSPLSLDRFAAKFAPAGFDAKAFLPLYGLAEITLVVCATPPMLHCFV